MVTYIRKSFLWGLNLTVTRVKKNMWKTNDVHCAENSLDNAGNNSKSTNIFESKWVLNQFLTEC